MNKKKKKVVAKKKKISKKVSSKKPQPQELRITLAQQPVAPTIDQLTQPMTIDGKGKQKKMALTKTWLGEAQLLQIVSRTPQEHIYERPGKGGAKFSYVTGNYVTKALNFTFGWNWDFEVVAHGKEQSQIWVHGKLTVRNAEGTQSITKSQFGRAEIKFLTETKNGKKVKTTEMLDFGNDLKAATTDALKKCASLLGIASDVYGKQEMKHDAGITIKDEPVIVLDQDVVDGPDGTPVPVCKVCGDPITEQEYGFSKKMYGKPLCREHQSEAKAKK